MDIITTLPEHLEGLTLLGPTSVGKGFLGKLIVKNTQRKIGKVIIGNAVRNRFHEDLLFLKNYFDHVKDGHLVPDDEICPMFVKDLHAVRGQGIFELLDGFCRSEQQVLTAAEHGCLTVRRMVIVLSAKRTTCRERERDRNNRKPDGERTDFNAKSFNRRYDTFTTNLPLVLTAMQKTPVKIVHIDANGDIEGTLFPKVWKAMCEYGKTIPAVVQHLEQPGYEPKYHGVSSASGAVAAQAYA